MPLFKEYLNRLALCMCGGQTGSIAGGYKAQLVDHLNRDSGAPGSNPSLVSCIFSLPVLRPVPGNDR